MRRVEQRPRAQGDLQEIWSYSRERWGEERADLYIRTLDAAMRQLCEVPELGADCSYILKSLRKRSVERHRIFYYVTDSAIEIVRILHMSRDVEELLHDG